MRDTPTGRERESEWVRDRKSGREITSRSPIMGWTVVSELVKAPETAWWWFKLGGGPKRPWGGREHKMRKRTLHICAAGSGPMVICLLYAESSDFISSAFQYISSLSCLLQRLWSLIRSPDQRPGFNGHFFPSLILIVI